MQSRGYLLSARRLVIPSLGALALATTTIVSPVAGAQDDTLGQTSAACGLATGLETGAMVGASDSTISTSDSTTGTTGDATIASTSDSTTGDSTTSSNNAMAASPTTGDSTTTGTSDTAGTVASTPDAMEAASFDQQFIDMAIPHHATIVSAAGAALIRVEDPELRAVSVDIVLDQAVEVDKLRDLRMRLTGSSLPTPIDMTMMTTMPGMTGIDPTGMAQQMDPAAFTAQVCDAPEADLTFIDLTIAHHQVAVMMAQVAMDQATDPELRALATHSVLTQQAQIAELQQIRDRLTTGA